MNIRTLIARLETEDPDKVVRLGFHHPHSHRGSYEQLAFVPKPFACVGEMLAAARSAIGETYEGWKGGDYTMTEYSDCFLANRGDVGEEIGPLLLDLLLAQVVAVCEGTGRTVPPTHGWCTGCGSSQRLDGTGALAPHENAKKSGTSGYPGGES